MQTGWLLRFHAIKIASKTFQNSYLFQDMSGGGRVQLQGATRVEQGEEEGAALEATPGQRAGFFSQLPYKCYLPEVASVGD